MNIIPSVELIRLEENEDYGTFGVLKINKVLFCNTLEPVDKENVKNVSSIPSQQYFCKLVESPKYGTTFEVTNVPNRTHILIHSGNVKEHTQGCILLGSSLGKLRNNTRAILNSGKTYKAFMKVLKGYKKFTLTITEVY